MSVIAQLQPTLMDLAARYGQTPESAVIEILSASNELLDDMVWVEANDGLVIKQQSVQVCLKALGVC